MDTPAEDPLSKSGIYAITNVHDGTTYIGSTSRACGTRWRVHRNNLIKHKHVNILLQEAMDTFGIDAFTFTVLQTVESTELLGQEEQKWFVLFEMQGVPVYNIAPVRRGPTYHLRTPKPQRTKICLYCGNPFPIYPSQEHLKYCCHEHYILHTKRSVEERFWEQVDKSAGPKKCWIWKGSINQHGYGRFSVCEDGKGRWVLAHRYAFEQVKGPIPKGLFILHSCDVRPCVQPEHLTSGTAAENTADAVTKDRMPAGMNHYGCKLSDAQVTIIRALKGTMNCKPIAERFGISESYVSTLHNHRTRRLRR